MTRFANRDILLVVSMVSLSALGYPALVPAADGANTAAKSFVVTSAEKDSTHPFFGQGSKIGLLVDGVQGKTVALTRGVEYTFNVNTGPQHDFYFSSSPVGQGASTITDGVTGQFTYRGAVTIAPGVSTPDVIYYQCRNHRNMGGKIHVVDKGKAPPADAQAAVPAVTDSEASSKAPVISPAAAEAQLKQKIDFAGLLVNSSKGAQRVAASSNAQAKEMLSQARDHLAAAQNTFKSGDMVKAQGEVDETLRLVSAAGRLVPESSHDANDPKSRYKELQDSIKTFESSYKQHQEKLASKKSGTLDMKKFKETLAKAEEQANAGQYEEANKLLASAQRTITGALSALLHSETVVYDKSFATPAEEYEYELARYKSYEELIPLALEQKRPPAFTVEKMDELSKKAKDLQAQAEKLAAKGDHPSAIGALQEATVQLQRALMVAGVN
ncbi:MAG: hypothetical protein IDH49_11660 [Gammaproteobacteria bacterium]|nr:hypothetical protein [Gammaproteobacteria bacterium]